MERKPRRLFRRREGNEQISPPLSASENEQLSLPLHIAPHNQEDDKCRLSWVRGKLANLTVRNVTEHNHEKHASSHTGHSHDDHIHENPPQPIISKAWERLAVVGNTAIGAAQIATAKLNSLATLADGLHNFLGDSVAWFLHTQNIRNPHLTEQQREKRQKIANNILFLSSAGVVGKAVTDLAVDAQTEQHPLTPYTSGASLALSSYLFINLLSKIRERKKIGHDLSEYDLHAKRHMTTIDLPSAGLAVGGAIAQKYGEKYGITALSIFEPVAAIVSGSIGAWFHRPGNGHHHGEEHTQHEHHPEHDTTQPSRKKHKRGRMITAAATACAILLAGGGSKPLQDTHNENDTRTSPTITAQHPTQQQENRLMPIKPKPAEQVLQEVSIKAGDTIWNIEKEHRAKAGCETSDATLVTSLLTIKQLNPEIKDLNKIYPNNVVVFKAPAC